MSTLRGRGDRTPVGTRLATLVLSMLLLAANAGSALAASIQTDLWVYSNGDTVVVTGVGFGADEAVDVVTTDPLGARVDNGSAPTDASGNFTYQFVLTVTTAGLYDVVATGEASGLSASTQFDPPPVLSIDTSALVVRYRVVGSSGGAKAITIKNTGGSPSNLNIQSITLVAGVPRSSPSTPRELPPASAPARQPASWSTSDRRRPAPSRQLFR